MISQDYEITSYDDLIATLVARRHELGLCQLEVDDVSGLQDGYTAKVEAWNNRKSGRTLGKISTQLLLEALGVVLIVMTKDGRVLPRQHGRRLEPGAPEPAWPNSAMVFKRERYSAPSPLLMT